MLRILSILLCGLIVLASCADQDEGAVNLSVAVDAISAADVQSVVVRITAPDMQPMQSELVKVGSSWQGTIGRIPAGTGRTFFGEARGSNGTVLYRASVGDVTVSPSQVAVVRLLLQEASPPPPFSNTAPRITAMYMSSADVAPGEDVTLRADAIDANGDPLTFAWTASAGGIGGNELGATWQAPATNGTYVIDVVVTDTAAASDRLSVAVRVDSANAKGRADVAATFNTSPRVLQIASTTGHLALTESVGLAASISEPDGDTVMFHWSVGDASQCDGTFSADVGATTFTRTAGSDGACTLRVDVSDGRGGLGSGTLSLDPNTPITPIFAPVIDTFFTSSTTVTSLGTVVLRVSAHDPQGEALTFEWSTDDGSVTTTASTATSSDSQWQAPLCFSATTTVRVRVVNESGLATIESIDISGGAHFDLAPVSWWQGEGTAVDTNGANNGQLINGTTFVTGHAGSAFHLNGSNQYVNIPSSSNLKPSGGVTASAWVSMDSLPSGVNTFAAPGSDVFSLDGSPQGAYVLRIQNDGSVSFFVWTSTGFGGVNSAATHVPLGSFVHVAGRYSEDDQQLCVYVAGTPTCTTWSGALATSSTFDLRLGADLYNNKYLAGSIDEAAIYGNGLSDAELRSIAAGCE